MNMLSRPHPALVPTLTEVIEVGGDDQPPSASAMPGTANGSTTRRNVWPPRAPRSPDASSSDAGTRSSDANTGRITNGNQR